VAMSHLRQVENNIHLWSLNNNNNTGTSKVVNSDSIKAMSVKRQRPHEKQQKQPVHTFIGHSDVVFDIYWRPIETAGMIKEN
jgi:hypothetical protein